MSDFKEVKKRGGAVQTLKYPTQHQTLLEMGFESAQIVDALETAKGDLEVATALMFGETPASSIPSPKVVVPPMRVVGKQSSSASKVAPKQDIKEVHNKFMAMYKIQKCKEKANHDKRMCIYFHSNGDRRRNPFQIPYTCIECPNSTDNQTCPDGDSCMKAHNMLERMFHPELFKISYCQRGANGQQCDRGNLCAFAHSDEDHRIPLSQTLPKQPGSQTSAQTASASQDPLQVGKAMTVDSRQLDSIQDKLIKLIKSQGSEGIISSELPKRYSDVYNERLELTDEAGEKFRIKDLLLSHPCISVIMHKGVQPRYVYEDVPATGAAASQVTTAPTPVAPVSIAANTAKPSVPGAPLSYAALASGAKSYSSAIVSGKPAPVPASPAASETPVVATTTVSIDSAVVDAAANGRSRRNRGPSEADPVPSEESSAPVTTSTGFDFSTSAPLSFDYAPVGSSPAVSGGPRRRGPDTTELSPLEDVSALKLQISSLQSSLDAKSVDLERVSETLDLEVRKRDQLIAQLRQEKAAELNQFRHNISLIENALIETQRQESIYINEISLHDTINKSSRARDDLTKFVNILKLQLVSRISANESQLNLAATNVTKSTLTNFLHANGINGNLNGAVAAETTNASLNYLTKPETAVQHTHEAANDHVHNSGVLMCSLPGCGLEGSFICSACGKAGYCGADHQREHWVSHINDCTP